ncbi:alginate export family protein [Microbulbifer sp. CAU 1566]|uniref:alginate export family protein n=1 Tax=Microbulbifer sp. CAU 1566 TaxID=2933269 RepID=UPI002003907C|nr:alginate export family protein [Microbulbifer sp. CAU 1566]MCK7597732.1 alginate export family protein [Microbulbifer sp. CAU 1566]
MKNQKQFSQSSLRKNLLCLAVGAMAVAPAFAQEMAEQQAPEVTSIADALSQGDVTLGFRARSEFVDVDGSDVDLTSLQTRLTFTSAAYEGLSTLIEMDDVTHITEFEGGVSDPEGTEVNQAYLAYASGATTFKYGRQRILLDNQRFVGGVGFRQNEQTYDAFSVTNTSLADTTLFLARVSNVNRIFGEDSPVGDHTNDTYLLNGKYAGLSAGTLSGYAYLIDNEDAAAFSTDTYGARFAGSQANLGYTLEYAMQSAAANNPASYDADYLLAEGSYKVGGITLAAGYELLGADGADGQFITPLATLHKFQGWSDKFLGGGTGNISGGIEDVYLSVGTSLSGVKLALNYHQLSSDDSDVSGMDKLGSEAGFLVAGKLAGVNLSMKYSAYTADDFSADTDKLWLTAQAQF